MMKNVTAIYSIVYLEKNMTALTIALKTNLEEKVIQNSFGLCLIYINNDFMKSLKAQSLQRFKYSFCDECTHLCFILLAKDT